MSLDWTPTFSAKTHEWQWITKDLGNGWFAAVTDCSQATEPPTQTKYQASAMCPYWFLHDPRLLLGFAEAKSVAISLTVVQKQASNNPECIVKSGAD